MRVDILSLFPEMFPSIFDASMLGIAQKKGILDLHYHNLRDWTSDIHRKVDDEPYGGGAGMVMKCQPIFDAIESIQQMDEAHALTIFFTPTGKPFVQSAAQSLSHEARLLLVCGRYEGFDERTLTLADMQISIGDYVLTGGELAAMVVVDAVTRLIPGVLGHQDSAIDESFSDGMLEYPHYTRPASFRGLDVPDVLLSGNHAAIKQWRENQSTKRTQELRPDLLH